MDQEFTKKFLTNTEETGKFVAKSLKTGKIYYTVSADAYQPALDMLKEKIKKNGTGRSKEIC